MPQGELVEGYLFRYLDNYDDVTDEAAKREAHLIRLVISHMVGDPHPDDSDEEKQRKRKEQKHKPVFVREDVQVGQDEDERVLVLRV